MQHIAGWVNTSLSQDAARGLLASRGEQTCNFGEHHACFGGQGAVHSAEGVVLVFSGRPELPGVDAAAGSSGDWGGRIIELYRARGESFPASLGGAFSLALYDHQNDILVLAIDRIGQKNLCFARVGKGLVFGSTTDLVKVHPEIDAVISAQSVYDYVYFHYCPSPRTIYSTINKLEGAQSLVLHAGEQHCQHYWQPEFCEVQSIPLAQLKGELLETLTESTRSLVDSVASTGAFLSGGLDSSSVVGALDRAFPGQANSFSIGFPVDGYDELEYARLAVKTFNAKPHEYYISPEDVLEMVPRIAAFYDEPFGNSSALPTFYCAQMARNAGMTHLLAGDGGDEIFAGNARYAEQRVFAHYHKAPRPLRRAFEGVLGCVPRGLKSSGLLHKASRYVSLANTPLPDRLQDYNFLHRNHPEDIFQEALLAEISIGEPLKQLQRRYREMDQATELNQLLYLDWKFTLHDNDLVKVNRMCELAGIDVRYPLLHDNMVQFSSRIPSATKLKGGELRWFYKQAMQGFLPERILHKSKHGFGLPFGIWLRDFKPLQELAYDSIASLKSRHYFKPAFLDHARAMHQSVHAAYYGELIWILMMLELWLESHSDT